MPKIKLSELDWGGWLYALLKAGILGFAGAIVSYFSMPILSKLGVAMPDLTLRQLGLLILVGIGSHMAAVLMKSPLPPADGSPMDTSTVQVSSVKHDDGQIIVANSTTTVTTQPEIKSP